MNIDLSFSNSTKSRISKKVAIEAVEVALKVLKGKGDAQIGINIVGEKKIRNLNKAYRNKDKVTDILSFVEIDVKYKYRKFFKNYDSGLQDLGEMFICWQEVERKAKQITWTKEKMFVFLVVHGVLHLLGYDHIKDKDAEKMERLEKKVMVAIETSK